MRAVVLVGGFGTRLRPLTLGLPKQMLTVGRVTMLERVVEHLGASGVDEVVLSLGYQPDAFLDEFPDGTCAGVRLSYAVEPEPLDTAGAIAFAARHVGVDERFIAVNGDVLTDLDVADLWACHERFGGSATIALTPVEDPSRFGVVPLDAEGRVEAFIEKPDPGTAPSNWINAGTYVLEPEVLDLVPGGRKVSIEREVFPALVERGGLYGVQSESYWIDAGTPEAYLQAHLDLVDGVRPGLGAGIDPSARIDGSAKVHRSVLGQGVVVAAGAHVEDSVLLDGARVSAGAVVRRSIVGGRAVVGEASDLSDLTVVGFDEDVPPGTVASGGRFPGPETWGG
ncbi:MAG: sugar phosphate nucleotidyltransferase [Microthrixaceae bacterium]